MASSSPVSVNDLNLTYKSIFEDGILFDLDSFWWKGFVQLEAEDIDIIKEELPDVVSLGRVRLLKHEAFESFQLIESRARVAVDKFSYPFTISTARFVPFTVLLELTAILTDLKRAFQVYVDVFMHHYDENKENFLIHYGKLQERIKDRYPNVMTLRKRFNFSWMFFELDIPAMIRADNIYGVHEIQYAVDNSKEEARYRLERWVDNVGIITRKEILNTCQSMFDSLEAGHAVRESTLSRARETIKRLRQMNFTKDSMIDVLLDDLGKSLPGAFERDIPAVALKFKGDLNSIIQEINSETDITEFTQDYKGRLTL